ncbi:MAG: hypothetical protein FJ128_06865 [Deltaproteobacteria bacterium]|nr:hypothetical protein [Deltaproteobacteria bacterium]
MEQAQEKDLEVKPDEGVIEETVAKVRAIAKGPHGDLFCQVVETFYQQTESEIFSQEDLADIREGVEEIRQGNYLTLEEYRQGKRL